MAIAKSHKEVMKNEENKLKIGCDGQLGFPIGPKIFPGKILKSKIFFANLKGLAKVTKELEHLRANCYAHCSGGRVEGETESNP